MTRTARVFCLRCGNAVIIASDALSDTCPWCKAPIFVQGDSGTSATFQTTLPPANINDPVVAGLLSQIHSRSASTLVFGPTGTGKTTLLSYLLTFYDPQQLVIACSNTPITLQVRSNVRLLTAPTPMHATVLTALAQGPNALAVDELRSYEARLLAQAGHNPTPRLLATLHAHTPRAALERFWVYANMPACPPDGMSPNDIRAGVCGAARYLVGMRRDPNGARVISGIYEASHVVQSAPHITPLFEC